MYTKRIDDLTTDGSGPYRLLFPTSLDFVYDPVYGGLGAMRVVSSAPCDALSNSPLYDLPQLLVGVLACSLGLLHYPLSLLEQVGSLVRSIVVQCEG